MPTIPLGPFELVEPLGRGGMGVVWRALHSRQRIPVAIKILSGEGATDPKTVKSFRNEVRSVAGLSHPGIVMVLDHGRTDHRTERASRGRIPAEVPYMAMELASGGSLSPLIRQGLPWRDVKAVLLSMLDALAHAHARGILHRDLKPGNVLICTGTDLSPGLKLSDFGIATAIDWHVRSGSLVSVAGTLHYMAPEQLLGARQDFGPWTDLYSLGCMAYRMITGRLPFKGLRGPKLMRAQLMEKPPPPVPRMRIPDGFEDWLDRLLRKQRRNRFQRAADAAWALNSLDDPDGEPEPSVLFRAYRPVLHDRPDTASQEQARPELVQQELATLILEESEDLGVHLTPVGRTGGKRVTRGPPPFPRSWRRRSPPRPPLQLIGAGLGLYRLRTIPFVGREEERDQIWHSLEAVHKNNTAELCMLTGSAGTGKSRLAEWICQRAHEVGAAIHLLCRPKEGIGPTESLGRMVARYLHCTRAHRAEVQERVEDFLHDAPPDEVQALTEVIEPAHPNEGANLEGWAPLDTAEKRYSVLRRFLERVATERPVILLFEDVHANLDALGFAGHLLRTRATQSIPVLVLATCSEDAISDSLSASARLKSLMKLRGAHEIPIEPLSPLEHHQLVSALIGMEGSLAAQVEQRTRGNPLFAVELVGNWVERGLLEVGPSGFELVDGAETRAVPPELLDRWDRRIDRVLEDLGPQAEEVLERAAILGMQVDRRLWRRALGDDEDRRQLREVLEGRLVAHRLAHDKKDGFAFANALIREALLRRAQDHDRWSAHHQSCARVIAELAAEDEELLAPWGVHLLESGQPAAAVEPLLNSLDFVRNHEGDRAALTLLSRAEEAAHLSGAPPSDPVWGEIWIERSGLFRSLMRFPEALRWSGRAVYNARRQGWQDLLPSAMREQALGLIGARRMMEARALLSDLELLAAESDDVWALAGAHLGQGLLAAQDRRMDRATELLERAADEYRQVRDEVLRAHCLRMLATYQRPEGEELFREAMRIYRREGLIAECARCWNGLAECARLRGDLGAAESGYRRARQLAATVGRDITIETLNLALVQLMQRKFDEARRTALSVRQSLEESGRATLLAASHAVLVACSASDRDWPAWDHHHHRVSKLVKQSGFHDPDLAWTLNLAGELTETNGQPDRAYRAYQLARAQWQVLDEPTHVAEVEVAMRRLAT